ncbi:hypothetical protein ACJ41O_014519 [Fusarium nematophilum]
MEDTQEQGHSMPVPEEGSSASAPAPHQQLQSTLFRLFPPEVRHLIYSHLFDSTRIASGRKITRGGNGLLGIKLLPARNSLALLRSCRRVHDEIGTTWVGWVLFSFEDPETMLDKLAVLPPQLLSKVRRVYVRGDFMLLPIGRNRNVYPLTSVLRLLPGLRLDTLTVLGQHHPRVSQGTLESLVCESAGWKELRCISHSSELMGFALQASAIPGSIELEQRWHTRKPQPAYWQGVMEDRDGAQTRPSVTIYRATVPRVPGAVLSPATRELFEQEVPEDRQALEAFGRTPDTRLLARGEVDKEIMVVVRRGHGVDYDEKGDPQVLDRDIRVDAQERTWGEIRRRYIDGVTPGPYAHEPVEIDAYENAEQYTWPPYYFRS